MITEVWVLEAVYSEESYIIGVFDQKPARKQQSEMSATSLHKGADEYTVSKWFVNRIGKR